MTSMIDFAVYLKIKMAQSFSAGGGTSNRRYLREHNINSPNSPRYAESDWETKEVEAHLITFLINNPMQLVLNL